MRHTNAVMAKIALRTYLREIERLVENGYSVQAMAHCRAILAVFPRHLAAARLLGNAALLAADYPPAKAAYLQVLACLPDDPVSHIGLSVLLETGGELEPAVWHMQRAAEIQPANTTLQEELQRLLHLRSETVPPPPILTRYALARMYQKGALYPQASAEILAALADEPQRLDLQCLLIQIYRQNGQIQDALQAALPVLERLPDCLEANLALFQAGVEQSSTARRRLEALEPHYTGLSGGNLDPGTVPDNFIQMEKFEG